VNIDRRIGISLLDGPSLKQSATLPNPGCRMPSPDASLPLPASSSCITTDLTSARAGEYQWPRSTPLVPHCPWCVALHHNLPGVVHCSSRSSRPTSSCHSCASAVGALLFLVIGSEWRSPVGPVLVSSSAGKQRFSFF
jgi:hypothetical protein